MSYVADGVTRGGNLNLITECLPILQIACVTGFPITPECREWGKRWRNGRDLEREITGRL